MVEHVGVELEEGLVGTVVVDQLRNLGEVHTRCAIHTVSMAMLRGYQTVKQTENG